MTRILGIDPGLVKTGWGVIDVNGNRLKFVASGKISPGSNLNLSERLLILSEGITSIIRQYQPNECSIEETFVNKNALTSLKLGQARGAIILTIAMAGIPTAEYAATLVKKTITGVGRAEKAQMGMMVKCLLPNASFSSEDAADALAIAICHANHDLKHIKNIS